MSSVYKLHIHKWAEKSGLNLMTIGLVQEAAIAAPNVYELVRLLRSGKMDERLPGRPAPAEWLSFYSDHRALTLAVSDAIPEFLGSGKRVQESMNFWRGLGVWSSEKPEEFEECLRKQVGLPKLRRWWTVGWRRAHRDYKRHLEAARDEMRGKDPWTDAMLDRFGTQLQNSAALVFYLRVALPCLFVERTWPIALLRQSGRNNEKAARAIECLIRLDEQAMHFPTVERWLHAESGEVRGERQRMAWLWRAKGLDDGQFSVKQVKQSLAGLMAAMAEKWGGVWDWKKKDRVPPMVTAESWRALYHAVAQDRTGRVHGVYDEDIVEIQTESWARRVGEHRKAWLLALEPPLKVGQKSS